MPTGKRVTHLPDGMKPMRPTGRWTPELQARFVEELRKCFAPASIAHNLGISYETYRKRKNTNPEFKAAVEEARKVYTASLYQEVHRRAVDGVDKGVYYEGVCVAKEKVYSDGLLLRHITKFDPSYQEKTASSVDQRTTVQGNVELMKDGFAGLSLEGARELRDLLKREAARKAAAAPEKPKEEEKPT